MSSKNWSYGVQSKPTDPWLAQGVGSTPALPQPGAAPQNAYQHGPLPGPSAAGGPPLDPRLHPQPANYAQQASLNLCWLPLWDSFVQLGNGNSQSAPTVNLFIACEVALHSSDCNSPPIV